MARVHSRRLRDNKGKPREDKSRGVATLAANQLRVPNKSFSQQDSTKQPTLL
ncbi:MAG TPA: hypothetical protein V6C91_08270 [Coleofasciculaceae cyanobacterium]